jgi:hypothetical protein
MEGPGPFIPPPAGIPVEDDPSARDVGTVDRQVPLLLGDLDDAIRWTLDHRALEIFG